MFGFGNFHRTIQKQHILTFIEFPISKDPTQVFLWLDKELDILRLCGVCGGTLDNTFVSQVIDQGLQCTMNPNSVFIENTDFWSHIRRQINELEAAAWNYDAVKRSIYKFWQSRRNKRNQVDNSSLYFCQHLMLKDLTKDFVNSVLSTGKEFLNLTT